VAEIDKVGSTHPVAPTRSARDRRKDQPKRPPRRASRDQHPPAERDDPDQPKIDEYA
jgi:hypothetical protein